jgi:hypothetical protein
MKFLLLLPLLAACTAVPVKDAVEGAVKRRVEAHADQSVQVCSCQTSCSMADIPATR